MVDYLGNWTAEKDYTNYPEDKMCDMDKIAKVVLDVQKESNYKIETDIENLCHMLLVYLLDDSGYYDEDDLSEDNIRETIRSYGSLREFDYNC